MPDLEVPVLIAGGSLVGMSAAMLLGHHGIRATVVEHHRGTAIHPRAAMISQRTMEILRTVGLESIVREESEKQFVQDGAIMAVETLAGKEIAYFIPNLNEGVRDVSPTVRLFITQKLLEPLLQRRAQELGADLRFSTELESFEQDSNGVTAVIRHRDTGSAQTVRARYMIAADGPRSGVRERLGIRMLGRGIFSNSITIYFTGDVNALLRGRNLSVILVANPTLRGFFRIEKPFTNGFLVVNTTGDPRQPNTDLWTGLNDERCIECLRAALGDDIPISVDSVMQWNSRADVAETFQYGRVFLAGDSAHTMPPYGGFGGNTGVQDANNLAWKLALVIKGLAGEELLSTYEPERRPAGVFTTEQAYARYVTREAKYLDGGDLQPLANDLNIELGYRYRSTAIVADTDDDGHAHENPRESKGKPGTRAPYVWIAPNRSTLDLFGGSFVLLTGADGGTRCETARAQKVDVHMIANEGFCDAYGITPQGAVLVRPDGFVAWRSRSVAPVAKLTNVMNALLHRRQFCYANAE